MSRLGRWFKRSDPLRLPGPARTLPPPGGDARLSEPGAFRLPRFRSGAAEQLDSRQGGPFARARIKLRDAFTPSQPVSDPQMFAGRLDLLTTLIGAIEDQRLHAVLYGDRGIGKTSLLHVLARQAAEARYLVHYASCGEDADFGDLFRAVATEVPLLYHRGYAPTSSEVERDETLASLLPSGPVGPRQISDLFAKLTNTRLLIILDEFDRSPSGTFRRQIAELIKTLSDRSIRVQLVIAGVGLTLNELVEHIPSIRRNILGLAVTSMSSDELEELIRNGERMSGIGFDHNAIGLITSISAGSPYLAGLLAQHASYSAVDHERASVGALDIKLAVGRAAEELAGRISDRSRFALRTAREEGREEALVLLAHAALQKGGRFGGDALQALAPAPPEQTRLMAELGRYGLIDAVPNDPEGKLRFLEEGVPTYLWMSVAHERLAKG